MATIPSIAMIPSGVKASKLYSVLPTDGTGDFTTTRASVATRVNENGLIEEVAANVPRLDYSDGTCPSLLLEPSATNLITYSEDFSDASWAKSNTTITSNSIISPDGTLTADTLTSNNTNSSLQKNYTGVSGTTYTASFYVKRKTGTGAVSIKSVENINTTITVTNEWSRVFFTATSTSTVIRIGLSLSDASDEIYIWGAQLEQNSYSTSYIKTVGTTQTRVVDTASGSGNSTVINSTEGVLYAEMSALANDGTNRMISLSDGTTNNRVLIKYDNVNNRLEFFVFSGGVGSYSSIIVISNTTINNKIAFKYKINDFSVWINGIEEDVNVSGITPIGLSELTFNQGDGAIPFYGKTKDLRVYTTALSDSELAILTTI